MNKLLFSMLASLTLASPAVAGDKNPVFVESKFVKDKPAVTLDPGKAYILLRTDMPVQLTLMRVPNAGEQAVYDKLRAAAFAEAVEKYPREREKYEKRRALYASEVAHAAKMGKPKPRLRLPDEPVEPTESNFEFTPFGLMAMFTIGPIGRFAKGEGGASTYLQEVTPGEYRIYGPTSAPVGAAPVGTCFCMGSVKFEARAGEIVDMGVIFAKGVEPDKAPAGDSAMPKLMDIPDYLAPAPAGMALDPRLAQLTVRRAAYRPVGKLPNYFGVAVGRIPAMPGVLRYERDRIVDLTAAN